MDAAEREAWRRADRILDALLDLPAHERVDALDRLAPDSALRARVRRLLAAHETGRGPLDQTPAIAHDALRATDALAGRRLGRWVLERELGRGGMSVVYRAQACEGATGQLAAVKVLTLGALAHGGHERFLREQQALLRLRHPYIAALYDAGVAEDGTAWLAMALVEGERIDAWCEAHARDLETRVRLVRQVCEALSYAHRNLVIHRDIKPSNVLVDGDGHVRLLDFGIARLVDHGEHEATATALRALTPEYAAPEQFDGAPPGTAMDVYGVGALLYRLLTGSAPRSGPLRGDEAIAAPSRAAARSAAAVAWTPRLRGDLDTVVLKALAAVPDARYASVEALSDDLARWLDRRPVRAHPPSFGYRLRKYVSRHRLAIAAATLTLCALLGGIAGTLWQARIARQEAARARAAAAELAQERDRAKSEARRAEAVRDFLGEIFYSAEPTSARGIPDAMDLLDAGSRRAREDLILKDPLIAADILAISGGARVALNDYEQGEQDLALAIAILERAATPQSRALADANWRFGILHRMRGDSALARRHFERAVELAQAPDVPVEQRIGAEVSYAAALGRDGDTAEAERRLRGILDAIPALGLSDSQVHLDALNALTHMLGLQQAPLPERIELHQRRIAVAGRVHGPGSGWYAYTIADALPTLRKSPAHVGEAERLGREAVEITTRVYSRPHLFAAVATCNLAALYQQQERWPEARQYYDRALAIDAELGRGDLHAESCRYGRARTRMALGDLRGALSDLERSVRMLERLRKLDTVYGLRTCGLRAWILQERGDWRQAGAVLAACPGYPLAATDPNTQVWRDAVRRMEAHGGQGAVAGVPPG